MTAPTSEAAGILCGTNSWQQVASWIDHTLLKPDATAAQIVQLCQEAERYGFHCAFVNPAYVPLAVQLLQGTAVKVGAPVGFPLGASTTAVKRYEALDLLRQGARELDMVLAIGALKSGDRQTVLSDVRGVAEVVCEANATLKVILETSLLSLDEKILACELAVTAGAHFVKTSTGFAGGGATVDDVSLMRGVVGDRAGVKASGGVRSAADVSKMIQAGATRIGTSNGIAILRELGAP